MATGVVTLCRVDSGALPEELAERKLFGVRRRAFTGATYDRAGLFESADRRTIFLSVPLLRTAASSEKRVSAWRTGSGTLGRP
jgi:hypothetical protein